MARTRAPDCPSRLPIVDCCGCDSMNWWPRQMLWEEKVYCPKCATELPDNARFCMQCGTGVKAVEEELQVQEPQWDLCEVRIEARQGVASTEWRFVAEAAGPRGTYVVRTTDWSGRDPESDLERLTEELIQEGWERVEGHSGEVGRKFRRQTV